MKINYVIYHINKLKDKKVAILINAMKKLDKTQHSFYHKNYKAIRVLIQCITA